MALLLAVMLSVRIAGLALPVPDGNLIPICTGSGIVYIALDASGEPVEQEALSGVETCPMAGLGPVLVAEAPVLAPVSSWLSCRLAPAAFSCARFTAPEAFHARAPPLSLA